MRRLDRVLVLIVFLWAITVAVLGGEECLGQGPCPVWRCWDGYACNQCLCMKTDNRRAGVCVSLEAAPGLLAEGWEVVE